MKDVGDDRADDVRPTVELELWSVTPRHLGLQDLGGDADLRYLHPGVVDGPMDEARGLERLLALDRLSVGIKIVHEVLKLFVAVRTGREFGLQVGPSPARIHFPKFSVG